MKTFKEFVEEQDSVSITALEYLFQTILNETHHGDCTNRNHTCGLCLIETLLSEYHEYTFKQLN